jgi:hypothetical protein
MRANTDEPRGCDLDFGQGAMLFTAMVHGQPRDLLASGPEERHVLGNSSRLRQSGVGARRSVRGGTSAIKAPWR